MALGTIPEDRVRIFDKMGFPIVEFRTSVNRSWTLAGEGRAQFTVATNRTNVVNEKNIEFGNYLVVENSVLPSWVGVIDTPRTWSNRSVTVSAYTPERLFSWRTGPMEQVIKSNAAGIFATLLKLVNSGQLTLLRLGITETFGLYQMTIHPQPLSQYLAELVKQTRQEYSFRPYFNSQGNLFIMADWRRWFGAYYNIDLLEGESGGNIEAANGILVEDGKIVNQILGYGEGDTWTTRPHSLKTDGASAARYGLRTEGREYRVNATYAMQVMSAQIQRERFPKKRFSVTAINEGDTFKYLQVGNALNLKMQGAGFFNGNVGYRDRVRIIGMSYDPITPNKIKLVLEDR